MKNALSLVCMSLLGFLLSTSSFAQSNTLFNPDYNGDGFVGVDDILGALSFYDNTWETPIFGCTYEDYLEFNPMATIDDGSCVTPSDCEEDILGICGGNCNLDFDLDGVCDGIFKPFPYSNLNEGLTSTILAAGFQFPYGIAVLDSSTIVLSDRDGGLFKFQNGATMPIAGGPETTMLLAPDQGPTVFGGYMDVCEHPNYAENGWIYLAFLDHEWYPSIGRFRLDENVILEYEEVFRTRQPNYYNNGMRMAWENDSVMFFNIGASAFSTVEAPILIGQDLEQDGGKIHRIFDDGQIPEDNPFEQDENVLSIWSFGHRDVQGLFYDHESNVLYGVEHGPKGGDELNVIQEGGNYGWPLFTYGIHYDGSPISLISEDSAATTTTLPLHYWTVPTEDGGQAIAPSTVMKITDSQNPNWHGKFLVSSLAFRRLVVFNSETGETHGTHVDGRVRTIRPFSPGKALAVIEQTSVGNLDGKLILIEY